MQKLKSNNGNDSIYSGFFHSYAYEERRDYEKYKSGSLDELSEDRLVQMEVLDVLEKLSFPMDKMGTYLYKDMIVKVMRYLNGVDDLGHDISEQELLQELKSPFSQFYFDLARNEMDIGLKTFHSHIEHALESVDYGNADTTLLQEIYSNFSEETDYGEHALLIGKHIKKKKGKKTEYQYTLLPASMRQVSF